MDGDFLVLELILLSDRMCGVGKKEALRLTSELRQPCYEGTYRKP